MPSSRAASIGAVVFLFVFSAIYYSFFYNVGFNLADEGTLLYRVQQILAGAVFYKDFADYGPLWYYPIAAWCFFTGEEFQYIRIFLFFLASLTGFLVYFFVRKITGNLFAALLLALIVITIPAPIHKIWLPFCSILLVVVYTKYLPAAIIPKKHFFLCGLAAAFASLVRTEFLWVALAGMALLLISRAYAAKRKELLWKNGIFCVFGILTLYLPFFIFIIATGVAKEFFIHQFAFFITCWNMVVEKLTGGLVPVKAIPRLEAPSLSALFNAWPNWTLAAEYYVSLVLLSGLILLSVPAIRYIFSRDKTFFTPYRWTLTIFLIFSSPIYFSFFAFRPDHGHFMQFFPCLALLAGIIYGHIANLQKQAAALMIRCAYIFLFILAVSLLCLGASVNMFAKSGPPLIKQVATEYFSNETLSVYVQPYQKEIMTAFVEHIERHTRKGEYIAAYPYIPSAFALTKRKSLSNRLYVDNATPLLYPKWEKEELERLALFQPKVIVLMPDWAINGTDDSRFKIWAKNVFSYIQKNYSLAWDKYGISIYVK